MRGIDSPDRTGFDVLEYEFVEEQAAALGRLGRALEAALDTLRVFDAAHPRAGMSASERLTRRTLVTKAGNALWMFVVQREACGLRDSRAVVHDYNVPVEVLLYSGCPEPVVPLRRRDQRARRQTVPRVG